MTNEPAHEPQPGVLAEERATNEQILSRSAPEGDLHEALARRSPRGRALPPLALFLVGLLLLGGGFLAGVLTGKHATASSTSASGQAPGGLPRPSGAPGGGAFDPASGFAVGTVTRVSGDTVYLQTADGTSVAVVTNGSTTIRVTTNGGLSDLTTGSTVVVQGTPSESGGTITATSITEGGLGGLGGNGPGVSPSP
jgi:hypothetical protein